MKQEFKNEKQGSIEAEMALLQFKEKGREISTKIKSTRKTKTYATIVFLLVTFYSASIFSTLNWPSNARGKILGVGVAGLFIVLFSESAGKYKGNMWLVGRIGTKITEETPAGVLRFLGWFFIFIPLVIALINLVSV